MAPPATRWRRLTNWLAGEFTRAGIEARIDTFFSSTGTGRDLPQVVAAIPGSDLAEELILVTAHLDAVRNTAGADDNASGIAALMGAARQLQGHRYRRTIQFVAFNDEEQGLIGSTDYARRLAAETRKVVGVLNMDMVAYDRDRDAPIQLQTNGTPASDLLVERLAAAAWAYLRAWPGPGEGCQPRGIERLRLVLAGGLRGNQHRR